MPQSPRCERRSTLRRRWNPSRPRLRPDVFRQIAWFRGGQRTRPEPFRMRLPSFIAFIVRTRRSSMDSLLFVNGTLMRGLKLHGNLDGATFLEATLTAPIYRLYSIRDVHPGMFEVPSGGVSVE